MQGEMGGAERMSINRNLYKAPFVYLNCIQEQKQTKAKSQKRLILLLEY